MYNSIVSTQISNLESGQRFAKIFRGKPCSKVYAYNGEYHGLYEICCLLTDTVSYLDGFTLVMPL